MRNISNWRAVAHAYFGSQHLLYLGNSPEQVKKAYQSAFDDVLTTDEKMSINRITLEKWLGKFNAGSWTYQDTLKVPKFNRLAQKD